MTILEAFVWIIGIIVAGVTITSVARSFGKATHTIEVTRNEMRKKDEDDAENNSEER